MCNAFLLKFDALFCTYLYVSYFDVSCHAAGVSPPTYDSEDDEDYNPSVEGGGDWRGVSLRSL